MNSKFPDALKINNRKKLPTSEFKDNDKLYHAFSREDLNDEGAIEVNTIRFPDFSCNWERFSKPQHVRFRKKKKKSSKSRRLEYRKNLLNNIEIELEVVGTI